MSFEQTGKGKRIKVFEETLEEYDLRGGEITRQEAFRRLLTRIGVGRSFDVDSWSDFWAVKRACRSGGYAMRVKIRRTNGGVFRVFRVQ